MGNPETKGTLGYDIVQRQGNEQQTRKLKVLENVGHNGCFTSIFLDNVCLIFVFKHSINYEINKIKNARILYI